MADYGFSLPMKYHPLRLVSWVNSTQSPFKPCILEIPSRINKHMQFLESIKTSLLLIPNLLLMPILILLLKMLEMLVLILMLIL